MGGRKGGRSGEREVEGEEDMKVKEEKGGRGRGGGMERGEQ